MMIMKHPKMITIRQAAEILGLSEKTISNECGGTAKLCRVRFGRSIRLIESEVLEFLEERIGKAKQFTDKRKLR